MTGERMKRNTLFLWGLIAILAVVDAIWLPLRGMSLTHNAVLLIFLPAGGLLLLAWFYRTIRKEPRIAALAHMAAATLAFMSSSCILSYLMVSLHAPLIDKPLVAADAALGLHWLPMYQWIRHHPVLHIGMQFVYMTLIPQIFILQIILNFRGQIARAWETLWLFILACLGCVICSGVWPAVGAFATFHVNLDEPYVHEFAAIRDGTLKIIGSRGGMQGLVEFPSLHMALAVLFPYALRGVRVAFPVFLVLNLLVAITTAPVGGHHFADLWAGALLAIAAIFLMRKVAPESAFMPLQNVAPKVKTKAKKKREGPGPSRI